MISDLLKSEGPTRSSKIVEALQKQGVSPATARKRISRLKPPLFKFPIQLLPKRESFIYHKDDRPSERFWSNLIRDMRDTNSVYAAVIDSLIARGGAVPINQFGVISSGTVAPKRGQVSSKSILDTLKAANLIASNYHPDFGECAYLEQPFFGAPDVKGIRWRNQAELILLDAVREWAKKLGLASYNKIAIRGEQELTPVGPYAFDLVGPSYLMPLLNKTKQPGFLVVDVVAEGILNEYQIRYFLRKAKALKASLHSGVLPILLAEGFEGKALFEGRKAGVILANHANLFGVHIAESIKSLLIVLRNAAAQVSGNPDKLADIIDSLTSIEGSAGNLRGILFELITAAIVRRSAVSIDIGVLAKDEKTGKQADIDILKVTDQSSECICIECKGKGPGGIVYLDEVEDWIRRIPIFIAHIRNHYSLREARVSCEIWTSGEFHEDALNKLKEEKRKRTKVNISWKDGNEVLKAARERKMKTIAIALESHYIKHPLATR